MTDTSIRGAAAMIPSNTRTGDRHEDVTYAVACVTALGSATILGCPTLPMLLHLAQHACPPWSGASVHQIAQVVGAAFQNGQRAGEFGTMVKLARLCCSYRSSPPRASMHASPRSARQRGSRPLP